MNWIPFAFAHPFPYGVRSRSKIPLSSTALHSLHARPRLLWIHAIYQPLASIPSPHRYFTCYKCIPFPDAKSPRNSSRSLLGLPRDRLLCDPRDFAPYVWRSFQTLSSASACHWLSPNAGAPHSSRVTPIDPVRFIRRRFHFHFPVALCGFLFSHRRSNFFSQLFGDICHRVQLLRALEDVSNFY